ncbi:HrpB1 family type III secretion system apparatus protein [Pandoraea sp. NPDC087047]|uniref:HrpB1 family type III secretion system apparatus protein n=1 Tax=Pandoraea sp. NPDC087047 TaxID=3364390 RepID=UPI003800601A
MAGVRGSLARYLPMEASVLELTSCPDNLVSGLIELLVTSVNKEYLSEAERLLAALHVMRPRFRELHVYDVWLLMGRKKYTEATQLLRELENQPLRSPYGAYVSALTAICLFSLRDPSWRIYANEVLARNEDQESVNLVSLLMGKRKEAEPVATAGDISPFATMHFMRA